MSEVIVQVQFIDSQTGKVFAQTDAPLSTLPHSFEAATQLEIGDQYWEVVNASPMTAEQFSRSGKLVLTLRRANVTGVNPKNILYSLPTICDEIPSISPGTTKLKKHVFELHEDNWRQIEFIALKYKAEIQAELADIRQIHEKAHVGQGFKALHIRKRISKPLNMSIATLFSVFPNARHYEGIAYERTAGLIAGGFGLEMKDFTLFGEQYHNEVKNLCIAFTRQGGDNVTFIRQFRPFLEKQGVVLVDWCRCAAFSATTLDKFRSV